MDACKVSQWVETVSIKGGMPKWVAVFEGQLTFSRRGVLVQGASGRVRVHVVIEKHQHPISGAYQYTLKIDTAGERPRPYIGEKYYGMRLWSEYVSLQDAQTAADGELEKALFPFI